MKKISLNKKTIIYLFLIILLSAFLIYLNFPSVLAVNKEVENKIKNMEIVVGGEAVGIKLLATGVLVVDIEREDTELKVADIILKVNDEKIETNRELEEYIKNSNGKDLKLEVQRKDKIFTTNIAVIHDSYTNEYKLGLWVKDSSAGVGTITFYDRVTLDFASLGHAVTETKENYVLPITSRWNNFY